ncbi:unnamed protein product [Amoebophrya sp. A25]|nr:unnamed protein product [Amoebophrya sp. A25]|eukprot:GSA25T00014558001.1
MSMAHFRSYTSSKMTRTKAHMKTHGAPHARTRSLLDSSSLCSTCLRILGSYTLLLLLSSCSCIRPALADLPVHCLLEDMKGHWIFHFTPPQPADSVKMGHEFCLHQTPNTNQENLKLLKKGRDHWKSQLHSSSSMEVLLTDEETAEVEHRSVDGSGTSFSSGSSSSSSSSLSSTGAGSTSSFLTHKLLVKTVGRAASSTSSAQFTSATLVHSATAERAKQSSDIIGSWTPIYDEGMEVRLASTTGASGSDGGERSLFAFSGYECADPGAQALSTFEHIASMLRPYLFGGDNHGNTSASRIASSAASLAQMMDMAQNYNSLVPALLIELRKSLGMEGRGRGGTNSTRHLHHAGSAASWSSTSSASSSTMLQQSQSTHQAPDSHQEELLSNDHVVANNGNLQGGHQHQIRQIASHLSSLVQRTQSNCQLASANIQPDASLPAGYASKCGITNLGWYHVKKPAQQLEQPPEYEYGCWWAEKKDEEQRAAVSSLVMLGPTERKRDVLKAGRQERRKRHEMMLKAHQAQLLVPLASSTSKDFTSKESSTLSKKIKPLSFLSLSSRIYRKQHLIGELLSSSASSSGHYNHLRQQEQHHLPPALTLPHVLSAAVKQGLLAVAKSRLDQRSTLEHRGHRERQEHKNIVTDAVTAYGDVYDAAKDYVAQQVRQAYNYTRDLAGNLTDTIIDEAKEQNLTSSNSTTVEEVLSDMVFGGNNSLIALHEKSKATKNIVPNENLDSALDACNLDRRSENSLLEHELPQSFDWRQYKNGAWDYEPIDQGQCGSCYVIASTYAFQARINIMLLKGGFELQGAGSGRASLSVSAASSTSSSSSSSVLHVVNASSTPLPATRAGGNEERAPAKIAPSATTSSTSLIRREERGRDASATSTSKEREHGMATSSAATTSSGTTSVEEHKKANKVSVPYGIPLHCSYYNQACDGGYPELIGRHLVEFGAPTSGNVAHGGQACETFYNSGTKKSRFFASDYGYVGGFYGKCSEARLMREIMLHGPVPVAIDASSENFEKFVGTTPTTGHYVADADRSFVEVKFSTTSEDTLKKIREVAAAAKQGDVHLLGVGGEQQQQREHVEVGDAGEEDRNTGVASSFLDTSSAGTSASTSSTASASSTSSAAVARSTNKQVSTLRISGRLLVDANLPHQNEAFSSTTLLKTLAKSIGSTSSSSDTTGSGSSNVAKAETSNIWSSAFDSFGLGNVVRMRSSAGSHGDGPPESGDNTKQGLQLPEEDATRTSSRTTSHEALERFLLDPNTAKNIHIENVVEKGINGWEYVDHAVVAIGWGETTEDPESTARHAHSSSTSSTSSLIEKNEVDTMKQQLSMSASTTSTASASSMHSSRRVPTGEQEDSRSSGATEASDKKKASTSSTTAPRKYWILRNSWGTSWGKNGYAYVPRGTNDMGVELQAIFIDPDFTRGRGKAMLEEQGLSVQEFLEKVGKSNALLGV